MSSAVSLELLETMKGEPDGIASLDDTGHIPVDQLPAGSVETYKGIFATTAVLLAAHPTGLIADYAYVTATNSFWYWNSQLTTPAWVNQLITPANYNALTTQQKAAVPYIVIP